MISGLHALAPRYDALFCDIWGVVHNGVVPHPAAVDALARYRAGGGHVILVSNAARPHRAIEMMLDRLGVPRSVYDRIVTSGDVTRTIVSAYAGRTIHHVGPPSDDPMFDGIDIVKGPADEAVAVVVTGLDDPRQIPADYAERMAFWRNRDLPFVCANPDEVVEVGNRLVYCSGALADIYEAEGGTVLQAGKPFPPIYRAAYDLLVGVAGNEVPKSRILAIGDSIRTDATGAAIYGIDLLFITGSIHAGELDAFGDGPDAAIHALVAPSAANLVGFLPRLAW